MRRALLVLLLALPAAASAQRVVEGPPIIEREDGTVDQCRTDAAAFEAKPTLAQFKALLPCLDDPDPRVRALVFDKLCRREVWEEPGYYDKDLQWIADQAAAKGQRDKDVYVSGNASTFRYWLENGQRWREQKARAAADQAKASRTDLNDATERQRIRLSFVFGAGVVLQTMILVASGGATSFWGLGAAALMGLIGLIPGKHEHDYELHFHIAYCFVVYAFAVFWIYKKEIMARVSESNLLINSLTLWYLSSVFLGGFDQKLVMGLAALPTLGTLVVAFTLREWSFTAKLACYVWFLVLTCANMCFQVGFGNLSFLFVDSFTPPHPLDLMMTGMAFTVLASGLYYIYILVPLKDKDETQEQRMQRWREDAHAMAGCFADYRLTAVDAAQILALQGGLYAFNHWARWLLPGTMMNVSMVVLPLAVQALLPRRDAPPAAAPAPAALRRSKAVPS